MKPRCWRVRITPSTFTPRMAATWARDTGCLYATIARVSRAAADRRADWPSSTKRSTYGARSAWLWNRHPPATDTSANPRPSASYSAAIASHSSVICATGSSSSCASSWGSTGISATISTASIARRVSLSVWRMRSAIVGIDRRQLLELGPVAAEPHDLDVAERARLIEVDEPLLEQLEHRQEPDHDVETLDQ